MLSGHDVGATTFLDTRPDKYGHHKAVVLACVKENADVCHEYQFQLHKMNKDQIESIGPMGKPFRNEQKKIYAKKYIRLIDKMRSRIFRHNVGAVTYAGIAFAFEHNGFLLFPVLGFGPIIDLIGLPISTTLSLFQSAKLTRVGKKLYQWAEGKELKQLKVSQNVFSIAASAFFNVKI
jgi:hypothetical protein